MNNVGRKTSDGIMFQKVEKKTLKLKTDRVNEAIRYFKIENITETNDLIKSASVCVRSRTDRIGENRI